MAFNLDWPGKKKNKARVELRSKERSGWKSCYRKLNGLCRPSLCFGDRCSRSEHDFKKI